MFKLDLAKAEEPEIKLLDHRKRKSILEKLQLLDYPKAFDCVDHNKLWKILREMGILDHLTCLLGNLYAGQKATGRTGHETTDWFQIGIWAIHCHPALLTNMQSISREIL